MLSDNYNDFNDAAESSIPDELRQQVDDELADGETVQWIEQPIPIYFTAESIATFLFGIACTVFALCWTAIMTVGIMNEKNNGRMEDMTDLLMPYVGLLLAIVGLCLLFAPLQNRRKMKRTVYAVTDQRAIIIEGGWFAFDVESYYPENLRRLRKKKRNNGSTDVYFAAKGTPDGETYKPIGFINIRNVDEVYALLRELKNEKQNG